VPTPMGNIEATFYLNGATYNNTPTPLTLTGAEWPNQEAQLHIVNNSSTVWEQPTIRILFTDNWGQKKTEEHTLPPLAPNESADLTIPIADFNLTRNENYPAAETSAWVQVYLSKGTVPLNESYWCVQYTVTP